MEELFRDYWWLVFPLGAFAFGAWDRWLAHKRSRDQLDLLRSYIDKGKDPPPELLRGLREEAEADDDVLGLSMGGSRRARRAYRRDYRWGPYWQWRGVIITGAVAAGFWWASEYSGIHDAEPAFRIVAVIMTFVAGANLLSAILTSSFRGR
jgi:hypothetical protein